jgi:Rieske 2Fe-2S family protein
VAGPEPPAARKPGSLRCPYHSWTYRLEGELLRAPWTEDVDGFDPAAFGLHCTRSRWRPGAASSSCT